MAMTDSDQTSTRGRTRDYSESDLTKGRRQTVAPERREYRSGSSRPSGMMQEITPRDVAMENA